MTLQSALNSGRVRAPWGPWQPLAPAGSGSYQSEATEGGSLPLGLNISERMDLSSEVPLMSQ